MAEAQSWLFPAYSALLSCESLDIPTALEQPKTTPEPKKKINPDMGVQKEDVQMKGKEAECLRQSVTAAGVLLLPQPSCVNPALLLSLRARTHSQGSHK